MKFVSHQQAAQLLHNKFVVVLGDSIQRGVYKDIVLLLQKETYLSNKQLKTKGEMSFEQDCLVEGGSFNPMNNGTEYRESVLNDFRSGLKPDVLIVNSCVWDISRYNSNWSSEYKANLHRFFEELREVLPEETLIIWNLTMPLGQNIRGGFLVPEIEHKSSQLRQDVIKANFLSGTLANSIGLDVLDLHYHFRHSLQHRCKDGVHWNALAHRCMTSLLLGHAAQAWGVAMPCSVKTGESIFSKEFMEDSPSSEYVSFEENAPPPLRGKGGRAGRDGRPPPKHHSSWNHDRPSNRNARFTDFNSMPVNYCGPDYHWDYHPPHHHQHHHHHHHHHNHQHVMRNRRTKNHYAPYY